MLSSAAAAAAARTFARSSSSAAFPALRSSSSFGGGGGRIRLFSALRDSYEHILVERRYPESESEGDDDDSGDGDEQRRRRRGGVGLIALNRPRALNALCDGLFDDLRHAAGALDDDDSVGCLVLTGSEKAFAAGADISEMSQREFAQAYRTNMFEGWGDIAKLRKPTIAAVSGFALGGGCELAMMCDILYASDTAKFGQPEINLGVIPGAGGTQRLVRCVGKSKAMEMCLTGNIIDAKRAERDGLVARVVESPDNVVEEAVRTGFVIASKGMVAVQMAKEAVNAADEMTLAEGLKFERRLFHALFATNDQKEGMAAFLEKRKPDFTDS
uniref:Probable enoyl-CoA hydratase, mitochondrial n=1 Tax=Odontella aurita TaxID=265563 RepID=A0A7S4NHY5_9STRA|mmetsp:Transcript_8271/g.24868  ORF Transcript_8271/g.24868 Transcript_8271/m.24868 type:complete len:329 (+) Transcript_8271:54-1040(+)